MGHSSSLSTSGEGQSSLPFPHRGDDRQKEQWLAPAVCEENRPKSSFTSVAVEEHVAFHIHQTFIQVCSVTATVCHFYCCESSSIHMCVKHETAEKRDEKGSIKLLLLR